MKNFFSSATNAEEMQEQVEINTGNPFEEYEDEGEVEGAEAGDGVAPDRGSKTDASSISRIQELIDGGKINVQYFPDMDTILHKSIKKNQEDALLFMLRHRKNVKFNIQNKQGDTPLHCAMMKKELSDEVISQLIDCGCRSDIPNNQGLTPFTMSFLAQREKEVILKMWRLDGNIKHEDRYGRNILYPLVTSAKETMDEQMKNRLSMASSALTYIQLILEPVEIYQDFSQVFANGGDVPFLRRMKSKFCVDLNHQDRSGNTILHHIVELDNPILLSPFLVTDGLDFTLRNKKNETVFESAKSSQVKFLLRNYEQTRNSRREIPMDNEIDKPKLNLEYNKSNVKSFAFGKGKVYEELINTEAVYVRDINNLMQYYFSDILRCKKKMEKFRETFYSKEIKEWKKICATSIFQIVNSIQLILNINNDLYTLLVRRIGKHKIFDLPDEVEKGILSEFTKTGTFGKLMQYYQFYARIEKSTTSLERDNKYVASYLKRKDHKFKLLDSFLIKPIQRLPRYILMLKELFKNYKKYNIQNENRKILESAVGYVTEVVKKIDTKKLQLKQSKHTLTISKYFRENFNIEILKNQSTLKYIHHSFDLPVLDCSPQHKSVKKIKLFVFNLRIYISFGRSKSEKLLCFDGSGGKKGTKLLLKITDNNHFSIKFLDGKNGVIAYFLVKNSNCAEFVFTLKKQLKLFDNPNFLFICLEDEVLDKINKFHPVV